MSISRIGGHGPSRGVDLAMLFREYSDQADARASAAAAAPAPQDRGLPQAPPVKAIDNPRRGSRALLNRIEAPAENRVRGKRSRGDAGDVVQGDIRRWNRMDVEQYQAVEAIPGASESEVPLRADKSYMRRLSDVAVGRGQARPAPEPPAPGGKKAQGKWAFGVSQALRERAQFARMHGALFDVSPAPSLAVDFP